MVSEAVHNYVNLVTGLTRITRDLAVASARALLAQAGLDTVAQDAQQRVTKLADEMLQASRANRELLERLVEDEVAKAGARWGLVRAHELESLRAEVTELRRTVVGLTMQLPGAAPAAQRSGRASRRPLGVRVRSTSRRAGR
jgi:polyhydroxyalkanoate synthesis regulator phasin